MGPTRPKSPLDEALRVLKGPQALTDPKGPLGAPLLPFKALWAIGPEILSAVFSAKFKFLAEFQLFLG